MIAFNGLSAIEFLEKVSAADFATGFVNVIDVSAIRDRAPAGWERRQAQVEEFITRQFRRRARESDTLARLNDAQFLVCQPGIPRTLAMACCGHIARDTLTHFLGADAQASLKLSMVCSVNGSNLQTVELEEQAVVAAMNALKAPVIEPASGGGPGPQWVAARDRMKPSTRVVVQISPRVEAVLWLDPIWSVQQGVVVSFLLCAAIIADVDGERLPVKMQDLNPPSMLALNMQMVDYASEALKAAEASGGRFRIHLPISVDVLTRSRERLQLTAKLQRLNASQRALIVVELDECGAGMPQSRLTELVSIIKPHCNAVVVRIEGGRASPKTWRHCGISGVAVVWDGTEGLSDRELMHRLKLFADAASAPRTLIIGHGCRRRGWALAAWAEGFTHLSGQVISDEAPVEGHAFRLSAADIFAEGRLSPVA